MSKPAPVERDVIDLIRERWSPYAFDAEKPVEEEKLLTLLEAARWAASGSNEQPWAFIVGDRSTDPAGWQKLHDILVPFNQGWAKNAPVLILALARLTSSRTGNPNVTAQYDTGMAVGQLLLQAHALGLHVHQMGGYDRDKAREVFAIPENYTPIAVIAIGYEGRSEILENDVLRARHDNPERLRNPLSSFVFEAGDTFGVTSPLVASGS